MSLDPASSVAGLIGVAGLFIQTASYLYKFCSHLKQVKDEVESIVKEMEELRTILPHIGSIIDDESTRACQSEDLIHELGKGISACKCDLQLWIESMQKLQSQDGKTWKKCVRHVKAAFDEGHFTKLRLRLAWHQRNLTMHLGVLNTNLGLQSAKVYRRIDSTNTEMDRNLADHRVEAMMRFDNVDSGIETVQSLVQTHAEQLGRAYLRLQSQNDAARIEITGTLQRIERAWRLTSSRKTKTARGKSIQSLSITTKLDHNLKQDHTREGKTDDNQIMRVVQSGLLVTESAGRVVYDFIVVEDPQYRAGDIRKIALATQLQQLRLIQWLLQKSAITQTVHFFDRRSSCSWFFREFRLSSIFFIFLTWSIAQLDTAFQPYSISRSTFNGKLTSRDDGDPLSRQIDSVRNACDPVTTSNELPERQLCRVDDGSNPFQYLNKPAITVEWYRRIMWDLLGKRFRRMSRTELQGLYA